MSGDHSYDHDSRQQKISNIQQQIQALSNKELNHIEHILAALNASKDGSMHYFGKFLGIKEGDDGEMVMNLGLHNENTYGVAQGGAVYTLADVAIGFNVLRRLAEDEKVFTLELKVNFIKKGEGTRLFAKPRILHWGRTTVVSDCSIIDECGSIVAQALGTFYLVKNKQEGEK